MISMLNWPYYPFLLTIKTWGYFIAKTLKLCALYCRQQHCGPFRIGANSWFHALYVLFSKDFPQCFFQIWLPCWPNFILKLSAFPAPIHRPDHVSQCTVQHKGVEEPIYRCCCNLHALRQRIQCLSGYLMSLLKGNDCFTMYESWVITSLRTSGMLYVCFVFISPSKLVWYKNMK